MCDSVSGKSGLGTPELAVETSTGEEAEVYNSTSSVSGHVAEMPEAAIVSTPDEQERLSLALDKKEQGNACFSKGDFEEATQHYTQALHLVPRSRNTERAVFLTNRAACYLKENLFEDAIHDCDEAVSLKADYAKAYYRRAVAQENIGNYAKAVEDLEKALALNPILAGPLGDKLVRCKRLLSEKQEREKEEMLGKLKELGNSALGLFGLSTDNFEMKQDPSTGSYSINFRQ